MSTENDLFISTPSDNSGFNGFGRQGGSISVMDATHTAIVAEAGRIGKPQFSANAKISCNLLDGAFLQKRELSVWQMSANAGSAGVLARIERASATNTTRLFRVSSNCQAWREGCADEDVRDPSMSRELRISKAFVFFGAAILNELDDEEDYRSHQQEMNHAALVQQKFGDDPDD